MMSIFRSSRESPVGISRCKVGNKIPLQTTIPTVEEFLSRIREHAAISIANAYM